jgi:hypothetical protein
MSIKPSQSSALNVLLRADLSDLMKHRVGNLHWVVQPDAEMPVFAHWSIVRMVKRWHEWLFIMIYKPTCPSDFMPSLEQVRTQAGVIIGDDSIRVDIIRMDKWAVNDTVAEAYSKGRM